MVDAGTLELKLKNLFKHFVCRQIRVKDFKVIEEGDLQLKVTGPGLNLDIFCPTENFDEKDFIHKINTHPDLAKYNQLMVTGVNEFSEDILKHFSYQDCPDMFYICKLPYRQLLVKVGEQQCFIKVCAQTYQKLLASISGLNEWPAEISFDKIQSLFKRKELVSLMLHISQLN